MNLFSKLRGTPLSEYPFTDLAQIVSVCCLLSAIQIWQCHGFGMFSIVVFEIGILSVIWCCTAAIKKNIICRNFLHNMVTGFILEFFALVMLVRDFGEIKLYLGSLFSWMIVLSVSIAFIVHANYFGYLISESDVKKSFGRIRKTLDKKNVFVWMLFLGILIIELLPFFNLWPRWDSFVYSYNVDRKSLVNLFQAKQDGLIICGHPISAYALLELLFKALFPNAGGYNSFYLSNIFLLLLDYFLIYKILKKMFHMKSSCMYYVLSFIFVCSPYILGLVTCNSPEGLLVTGILFFLCGFLSRNDYVCMIACYIVCNSRETGIPLMGAIIFVQCIYDIREMIVQGRKAKMQQRIYKGIYYLSALVTGVTSVFNFSATNWGKNMGDSFASLYYNDGTIMFGVRFSVLYIANQLKGIFLTNFTWVYLIFILLACVTALKTDKKNVFQKLKTRSVYAILLCGMIVSLLEICLFMTHHNYRYYSSTVLFVQILGICGLIYISHKMKKYLQNMILAIFGMILFVHCTVTTIDPVMLAVFPVIQTGNAKIAVMPWNINHLPEIQFLECARYNFQIPYFDKALDIVYSRIDPDKSRVFLYDGYQWGTDGNTLNSVWGHGYEFLEYPSWGVWNSEGQYRELSYNPDDIINPIPVSDYTQIKKYSMESEYLYYLELPWGDELAPVLKEKCPEMELYETIEYHGWVLKLYKF